MSWYGKSFVKGSGTTSMPVAPEGEFSAGIGSNWAALSSILTSPFYNWINDTSASDPGIGNIKGNNADLSLVTELYINPVNTNGYDVTPVLLKIVVDDTVVLKRFGAVQNYVNFSTTGNVIDAGGYYVIPVKVDNNNGGFLNNDEINLSYYPTGRNETTIISSINPAQTNAVYITNPQTKLDVDFSLRYEKAIISVSFDHFANSTNRAIAVGVFINDVLIDTEYIKEAKDNSDHMWAAKIFDYDFGSLSPQNIKIKYGKRGAGGAFVGLSNVRIVISEA